MTSYWNLPTSKRNELNEKGIDLDLVSCLESNPQPFDLLDIDRVLAVYEGEHDGDDWRWIILVNEKTGKKNGGNFVFLQGGCDYTGWDCQSWAKSVFTTDPFKAAEYSKTGPTGATVDETVLHMGLGRLIMAMNGSYMKNAQPVYDNLINQFRKK